MCGIAGILSLKSEEKVDLNVLEKMNQTMVHRGPDGSGLWSDEKKRIALAHRRLSIIDLSDLAAQPMSSSDGQIVVTYNGEIYNHKELRAQLEAEESFQWKTDHSDTEVLIYAYKKWGIDFLNKLRGMFSFALWDNSEKKLFLVRDRMGIKPLYWTQYKGKVYFASEIKAILEHHEIPRKINKESAYHYLTFICTPAPHTMFENIQKVPSGALVEIGLSGEIKEREWYSLLSNIKKENQRDIREWAGLIKEKLSESVKYRMESDVPVGVFLSGGIDSSTNAALFNYYSGGEQIKTFTVGYEDSNSYKSEFSYAQQMAQEVSSDHYQRVLTEDDLLSFMEDMVYYQDEPIADPVCFPVFYVSKIAADNGVKVCQVGEGADELFWGYPFWKTMLRLQKLNDIFWPVWTKTLSQKMIRFLFGEKYRSLELLRRGASGERIFWGGCDEFGEYRKKIIWANEELSTYSIIGKHFLQYIERADEFSDLDWMSYFDLKVRLPELLLMRVDKMSMANSLEARVPFLDHEFVELTFSIPEKLKTKNGILKNILKQSVRGLVPDNLIDRKKQGFGVPLDDWIVSKFDLKIKELVCEFNDHVGLFYTDKLVESLESKPASPKWVLFNLALWWKRFKVSA